MGLSNLPIGVFDSGVGGLTVLKQLNAILPKESYIYIGDLARLPYGKKSNSTILNYTKHAFKYLSRIGVKCIVIACNTAASISLHFFEEHKLDIPVIGVVTPGAKTIVRNTLNKHVAVLATEATINSGIYAEQIKKFSPSIQVESVSCPLLVSLAEEGWVDDPITQEIIARYLNPILTTNNKSQSVDCILLGCTHFPILLNDFRSVLPSNIKIVCSAEATALNVSSILHKLQIKSSETKRANKNKFLVTDNKDRFLKIAKLFLDQSIESNNIETIKLDI